VRGRAGPVFAALALLGVLALAVFPAKAYFDQQRNREELAAQLAALSEQNRVLDERAAQLDSNKEIERLARQYNLIRPGEEAYFILPRPGQPAAAAPVAPAEPAPQPNKSPSLWERITGWF
jgi:type II secretory pathway pseudopilin PulG